MANSSNNPKGEPKFLSKSLVLLTALLGLAFLLIVLLARDLHEAHVLLQEKDIFKFPDVAYDLGVEIFKTVFVAAFLGLAADYYIKRMTGDSTAATVKRCGIKKLYPSRQHAVDRFERLVRDPKVKVIYMMGISLREFLTQQGGMHAVWSAIQERLSVEEHIIHWQKLPDDRRLRVYLLTLNPLSSEGYFRYTVERPPGELKTDSLQAIAAVRQAESDIYGREQTFLRHRLYDHCPFSFVFFTNVTAFVEQYYYKTAHGTGFPLIEYPENSSHYPEIQHSINQIWERAHERMPTSGTAIPLKQAGITNIFRVDQRSEQAARQIDRIAETTEGMIDILTITGRHYVKDLNASTALRKASLQPNIKVRLLVINPISQQAIFRAIADEAVADERLKRCVAEWDWERHATTSNLYRRTLETIRKIRDWQAVGCNVELRLYSCAVASALLITPHAAFASKYLYGRSKRLEDFPLQSEYPMFEFDEAHCEALERTELEMLRCTFTVIWNYYSTTVEAFSAVNPQSEFNKNLQRLRDELQWTAVPSKNNSHDQHPTASES